MNDLPDAVDAYEHTARALLSLGRNCSNEDFELLTECPGWTVKDQFSHVVGVESWMLGRPEPAHELPELLHVLNAFARRVEVAVDVRRDVAGADVVAELADVLVARLSALRAPGLSPSETTTSPLGGEMPLVDVLALRTFDIWTHEQDVRRALGRPGNLGSPAAVVAVGWMRRVLPRVVARDAEVPVGRSVQLVVDGAGGFDDTVVVVEGRNGRPAGVLAGAADGADSGVDATLSMSTEAFMRRMCGRWAAEGTPATTRGDGDLARRVLAAMAVTP